MGRVGYVLNPRFIVSKSKDLRRTRLMESKYALKLSRIRSTSLAFKFSVTQRVGKFAHLRRLYMHSYIYAVVL